MDPADWPAPDGSSGITSSTAMDAAEAAGRAIEVGSNFFLFFSSRLAAAQQAAATAASQAGHVSASAGVSTPGTGSMSKR